MVRVTEFLDVLTPPSHIFSYIPARNICIPPKQWTSSKPHRAPHGPRPALPLSFPTLSTLPPPPVFLLRIRSQATSDISTPLSSTSAPSDGSIFPRKRRHEESSEHGSRSTASTGPKVMCRGPSSPLAVHSSTPVIPQRIRLNLALDATSTEPSPVPTEIATYLAIVEPTPDLTYESVRTSCKASEVFDSVASLIAADWHMRNPHKDYGLLTPKGLFRLIKIGWLTLAKVGQDFSPVEFAMLKEYNDLPDERRYPFVVPAN